jgi:hypothetical protein
MASRSSRSGMRHWCGSSRHQIRSSLPFSFFKNAAPIATNTTQAACALSVASCAPEEVLPEQQRAHAPHAATPNTRTPLRTAARRAPTNDELSTSHTASGSLLKHGACVLVGARLIRQSARPRRAIPRGCHSPARRLLPIVAAAAMLAPRGQSYAQEHVRRKAVLVRSAHATPTARTAAASRALPATHAPCLRSCAALTAWRNPRSGNRPSMA